ncbi:MAG: DUF3078 domain-containing protein [Candidatus Zixiibacteriota bacterium]
MRTSITILILALLCIIAFAWETSLDLSYNLSLNNYSDNWTGGDASGITWTANCNFLAQKAINDWLNTKNTAKCSFGHTHIQDNETKHWQKPIKSNDLIDIENIERFTLGSFVDPFVSVRFLSQFLDASVTDNKRAANPIEITESAGVARVFIKEEEKELITRFGGAFKQNIDRDVLDTLGNKETISTNDGGLEMVTEYRTPLLNEAVKLESKLSFYKALYYSEENGGDSWKSPDVNWDTYFTAKLSDVVSVKLNIQLLYDEEIDNTTRHKEIMSVGFIYSPF